MSVKGTSGASPAGCCLLSAQDISGWILQHCRSCLGKTPVGIPTGMAAVNRGIAAQNPHLHLLTSDPELPITPGTAPCRGRAEQELIQAGIPPRLKEPLNQPSEKLLELNNPKGRGFRREL